ncbi:hypothetical protein RJ639_028845 [Escallonia herrerae]|uniref:DELLA protein n=1 Tax=Escallonia herrerae TaxID=1293975 RepID=A0AA88X4C5_9ASTE|nr:hypothetical protein RJ639_028845 [Escallonia herrerae]
MNSLCGSLGSLRNEVGSLSLNSEVGSLKSANSCSKQQSNSQADESVTDSKKAEPSSDLEHNSLTPSSLSFPALKFEVLDVDVVEVQSPDSALWESFFTDHLDGDFMISSPVRNVASPQASNFNYNYNYVHSMHGHSLFGCSPPRSSSPLGPYSSTHKGKGLSPLQKVFNSPNNQYMQVESLSLPALENVLDDDYERDYDFLTYSTIKSSGGNNSAECYDTLTTVPALLDCLTLPNSSSSRFCGSVSETSGSQLTQESDVYQMGGSVSTAPLLQQLQQERQQEKKQAQQQLRCQAPPPQRPQLQQPPQPQNMSSTLMVPIPVGPEQEQDSGLQLVHLLLACAEAVAKEDYMLARRYLHHLNRVVTPLGDSMQRVASCFTEALSARLAATLTTKPSSSSNSKPFNPFPPDNLEILKIYQILYQACPYIKFAHFTANQAIFEAFEAEERVHVIDLDILQGYQWPAFMQALAARPGGPPFLRITGVGCSPEAVRETGRCLTELAHSLHVPFEFHPVGELLEDLKPHMFNRRVGEALAVNSVNRLQRVPGNALSNLLAMIRDQAPNIVTIVEQEASHNGPYFLGRFLEALHYYSAIFDSLDATFPPDSAQRAKVEQYIFAPEIRNIVAYEGVDRVMRHERLEKWRKIMEGKGFKGVPLSANAVTQSKILLGLYTCDGYRLTEDKGCLLLGWQDRAIIAASAWRC